MPEALPAQLETLADSTETYPSLTRSRAQAEEAELLSLCQAIRAQMADLEEEPSGLESLARATRHQRRLRKATTARRDTVQALLQTGHGLAVAEEALAHPDLPERLECQAETAATDLCHQYPDLPSPMPEAVEADTGARQMPMLALEEPEALEAEAMVVAPLQQQQEIPMAEAAEEEPEPMRWQITSHRMEVQEL